jgi:hypothetical protein
MSTYLAVFGTASLGSCQFEEVTVLCVVVRKDSSAGAFPLFKGGYPSQVLLPLLDKRVEIQSVPDVVRKSWKVDDLTGRNKPRPNIPRHTGIYVVFLCNAWILLFYHADIDRVQLRHARADPTADTSITQVSGRERVRIKVLLDAPILEGSIHVRAYAVHRREYVQGVEFSGPGD